MIENLVRQTGTTLQPTIRQKLKCSFEISLFVHSSTVQPVIFVVREDVSLHVIFNTSATCQS